MITYAHGRAAPLEGKILCMGDSITDQGWYLTYIQTWLDLFQPGTGIRLYNLGIGGENVSGLNEPGRSWPRTNGNERLDRAMMTIEPRYVFVMYGMNDGIYAPWDESIFAAYQDGIRKMVYRLKEYGVHIILMTPTPFEYHRTERGEKGLKESDSSRPYAFSNPSPDYDLFLTRAAAWLKTEMASEVDRVIDLHTALSGHSDGAEGRSPGITRDGVHPGRSGHWLIARQILKEVFRVNLTRLPEAVPEELLEKVYDRDQFLHRYYVEVVGHTGEVHHPVDTYDRTMMQVQGKNYQTARFLDSHPEIFQPVHSTYQGFQRDDFYYRGYEAVVVRPEEPNGDWIWRMEFFGAFDETDLEMVRRGYHLVTIRISDHYGAPRILPYLESFYYLMREQYPLKAQMIPFGFSRGGLYAMLIASAHPSWIRALYLDAPVVNPHTWPERVDPDAWEDCQAAWDTKASHEDVLLLSMQERIETMVLSEIPLVMVYGGKDETVPYEENGRFIEQAYDQAGIPHLVIEKPACGHHPHGLCDVTPVADFLTQTEDLGAPLSSYVAIKRRKK